MARDAAARELESALFATGAAFRDLRSCAALVEMICRPLRSPALGSEQDAAADFAWVTLEAVILDQRSSAPAPSLVAAQHLLALGNYDDVEAMLRELSEIWKVPYNFDRFLRVAKVRPQPGEPFGRFLERSSSARAALAALAAGFSQSRTAFQSGGAKRYRAQVVNDVMKRLEARLARQGLVEKSWLAFKREQFQAGESILGSAHAGGWGPARPQFDHSLRPRKPVLNSRVNHPLVGDERSFFRVQEIRDARVIAEAGSSLLVEPGRLYRALVLVSNDADPSTTGERVRGVRVQLTFPGRIKGSGRLLASIVADNVEPARVWGSVVIVLPSPDAGAAIRLVRDSAELLVSGDPADSEPVNVGELVRGGALVHGPCSPPGEVGPEDGSPVWVKVDFVVDKPDFDVIVKVRQHGSSEAYSDRVLVAPGDILDVKVEYRNSGSVTQRNVRLLQPPLPSALRYYDSRMLVANSKTNGAWREMKVDSGEAYVNLGTYASKGNCFVHFHIAVRGRSEFRFPRGIHWLDASKLAIIYTDNGSRSAGATIVLDS